MSYPKTLSIFFFWCLYNSLLSYKYAAMQMRVILCNHFAWKVFQRCCILKGPQTWTRALLVFPLVIYLQSKNLPSHYHEKSQYFLKTFLSLQKCHSITCQDLTLEAFNLGEWVARFAFYVLQFDIDIKGPTALYYFGK